MTLINVSEFLAASIIRVMNDRMVLMMDSAKRFEMPLKFYQTTRHNIPEDSQLRFYRV